MISQECGGFDKKGPLPDAARIQKDGPQAKQQTIEGFEIRGAFSRAGDEEQLLLQQQILGNQRLPAATSEEFVC